ncbi:AIR carboxylase family protein [Streptomyces profundus]|uniref:AIR carboxylase family protein n=1 Tax=Streptomyces profundus TaxID=2867410 RepID=UPI001D15EB0C|nr:AIR carboxylase family protein [Streptomyces sp. MA3_2.13]
MEARPARAFDVLVVTAGTADLPVAAEALAVCRALGLSADGVADVGVAGLDRVLAIRERLQAADAVVVAAGMEGALASVAAGLVGCPVVAVPVSGGYFCKSEVLGTIAALGRGHGFPEVATGTNADDAVDPHRPGIRAGEENGVHTPLRDTGLNKHRVRELSRRWRLPTWDKPATPCLASRIRHGVTVTAPRLARVARAEIAVRAALADAGLRVRDLRVRDLGEDARVEVDRDLVGAVDPLPGVRAAVRAAGFVTGEIRVAAFRSGSLHSG